MSKTIEELNQNVGAFVESATMLPAEVSIDDLVVALDQIDAIPSHLLGDRPDKQKDDARQKGVAHHLSQVLAQTFPVVSPELFGRQRWLQFELRRGAPWRLVGEALVGPDERKAKRRDEGGVIYDYWHPIPLLLVNRKHDSDYTDTAALHGYGQRLIRAKAPRIPPTAEGLRRKGMAVVLREVANLLDDQRVSHIVETMMRGRYGDEVQWPTFHVAWVPLISEIRLEVIPVDPALLLDCFGHKFLVTHWDAPGERPIEAILREYTSGAFLPPAIDKD